jgi:hypothetical protein
LQQAINTIHQQEQTQDPWQTLMPRQAYHYQSPPQQQQIMFMNEARPQLLPLLGANDNKCPLADDLQLAPWPL